MIPPGLNPDEYKNLLRSIGSAGMARPLSPLEVARLLEKAKSAGASAGQLAAAMHLTGTTMITRFLRLLDLDPSVHHLVHWGQSAATIAFSAATELARLSPREHAEAFRAALESALSGSEVKALVQQRLRSGKPLSVCLDDTVKMRPKVNHYHVVIGSITSAAVREALLKRNQQERDRLLAQAFSVISPELRDLPGRLGSDRFTVSYDNSRESKITPHKDGLENRVTDALANLLSTS